MNELLFAIHILVISLFLIIAAKFGKNSLLIFIVLCALLANLFVVKQLDLFSLSVVAGDVFSVGSIVGIIFLQKRFGKEAAKEAAKLSFFALIFFTVMAKVQIAYLPNSFDFVQKSFETIFSLSWRVIAASIASFWVAQRVAAWTVAWMERAHFLWGALVAVFFSELVDTLLFSFLALSGVAGSIFSVIIFSFCIKMVTAFGSIFALKVAVNEI